MSDSNQKSNATENDEAQDLAGSMKGGFLQNQSSQLSGAGAQIKQTSGSSGVSQNESHKESEADHSELSEDGHGKQPDSNLEDTCDREKPDC